MKLFPVFSFLFSVSAFASQVNLTPTAYNFGYNGAEAKALFEALKQTNAKAVVHNTPSDKRTVFYLSHLHEKTRYNSALDETDPCFNRPAYEITFQDENANKAKVEVNVDGNCEDVVARKLATVLGAMGGDKVSDAAMGKSYFTAPNLVVTFDPLLKGKNQYYAMGDFGPDLEDSCQ